MKTIPYTVQRASRMLQAMTVLLAALGLSAAVHAIPPSVMEPYRAYMAAIEAEDLASATTHVEAAYQAAVSEGIDSDTLADLAEKRAQIYYDLEDYAAAGPAWDDLQAISPAPETLALAASAYLLADDAITAEERARTLVETGSEALPRELRWLGRYVIGVANKGQTYSAATGNDALLEGRAPDVLREVMRAATRSAVMRERERALVQIGQAAAISRGLGMHADVTGHLETWFVTARGGVRDWDEVEARAQASLLSNLLIRQGNLNYRTDRRPVQHAASTMAVVNEASGQRQPRYPRIASQLGAEGFAIVRFDIAENGQTENIQVVFAVPNLGFFDEEILRAVRRWRYQPPVVDGVAGRRDGVQACFNFLLRD